MPQTALLEAPTTSIFVPAPRAATPADPNTWVTRLSHGELMLALALSDMPRTATAVDQALGGYLYPEPAPAPRRLTAAGTRTINAWVAQGVERAGGQLALWEAAGQMSELHRTDTWKSPAGKAFARRFGGHRRLDLGHRMEAYVRPVFDPVLVHLDITERTEDTVRQLARRYGRALENSEHTGAYKAVYKLNRHHAHMVARAFDMSLLPRLQGGYALV